MEIAVEYVDPASLVPAPWNPRRIDDASLKRLATLLDLHGFVDPVIARREDRLLIGGHQRLKANAIRDLPAATVPCIFLDGIDDDRAKALNIALNSHDASGEYDADQLGDLLTELQSVDLGVAVPDITGLSVDSVSVAVDGSPDFQPTDEPPPRLDEKSPTTCPNCGHEFTA